MHSFLLDHHPVLVRWETTITPLQQTQRLSGCMWAHSPHFSVPQNITLTSFFWSQWRSVFPFSLPYSVSLPLPPGDLTQSSCLSLTFRLPLPVVWFFSTFIFLRHSLQKIGKQKMPLAPNPKSLADLSPDFDLKLPSPMKDALHVYFNLNLPRWEKKKVRVHVLSMDLQSPGLPQQSLSPIDSSFTAPYGCVCYFCSFPLPPGPGLCYLKHGICLSFLTNFLNLRLCCNVWP